MEVLSRSISRGFYCGKVAFYYTPRNCDPIMHMLYADDTLIFVNRRAYSNGGILKVLEDYYNAPGQRINAYKSNFLLDKSDSHEE